MCEHTAALVGGQCVNIKLHDLLEPPREETRDGGDIAADVIKRAGLVVK